MGKFRGHFHENTKSMAGIYGFAVFASQKATIGDRD